MPLADLEADLKATPPAGLAALDADLTKAQTGLDALTADIQAATPLTFLDRVRTFLQPTAQWAGGVQERLAESGQAVLDLPSTAYKAATGQVSAMDLVRTGLKAIGAPFEPIFAPVGEAVRTAGEPYLGKQGAATAGAVSEMAMGLALPMIKVPSNVVTRGVTKIGIGRLPEEAVAAERAAAGLPDLLRELEIRQYLPKADRLALPEWTGGPTVTGPARTFEVYPPIPVETPANLPSIVRQPVHVKAVIGPTGRAAPLSDFPSALEVAMGRATEMPTQAEVGLARGTEAVRRPGSKVTLEGGGPREVPTYGPEPTIAPAPVVTPEQATAINRSITASESLGQAVEKANAVPIIRSGREVPKPLVTEETAVAIEDSLGRKIPEALQGTRLSTDTTRKVIAAAEDAFTQSGIARDADIPITLQIVEMMGQKPEAFKALRTSLEANGATLDDLAQLFMTTSSNAGRQLGQLGNLVQRLGGVPELADLAASLRKAQEPLSGWDLAGHFWSRFVNLWRGSLVTAMSTAIRNLETQVVRMGIEPIEKAVDGTLRSVFRLGGETERGLSPAFRSAMEGFHSLISKGKRAEADAILRAFPEESDRLFGQFMSDVERVNRSARITGPVASKVDMALSKGEDAVNLFNTVNRGQEFLIRRGAFRAKLADLLDRKGQDIERIIPSQVDPVDVATAVDHALEMTYAQTPGSGPFKWLLDLYQNPVGKSLSFMLPFPRFMYNSWKFMFDYSPAGFLKVLSSTERAAIAAGDTKTLSRAIIGTGLLGAAWEIRNSEYAGEKWYELKVGDKRVDTRPFNPFATYLFVAELAKRTSQGTLLKADAESLAKEIRSGVFAGGFRAGAGLSAVDGIVSSILEGGTNLEKASNRILEVAGQVAGGFLQPMTTFRELYAD